MVGNLGRTDSARPTGFGGVGTFPALATPPRARWCIVTVTDSRAIRGFSARERADRASGHRIACPHPRRHMSGSRCFSPRKPPSYLSRIRDRSSRRLPPAYISRPDVSPYRRRAFRARNLLRPDQRRARDPPRARIASGVSGGGSAGLGGRTGCALRYAPS